MAVRTGRVVDVALKGTRNAGTPKSQKIARISEALASGAAAFWRDESRGAELAGWHLGLRRFGDSSPAAWTAASVLDPATASSLGLCPPAKKAASSISVAFRSGGQLAAARTYRVAGNTASTYDRHFVPGLPAATARSGTGTPRLTFTDTAEFLRRCVQLASHGLDEPLAALQPGWSDCPPPADLAGTVFCTSSPSREICRLAFEANGRIFVVPPGWSQPDPLYPKRFLAEAERGAKSAAEVVRDTQEGPRPELHVLPGTGVPYSVKVAGCCWYFATRRRNWELVSSARFEISRLVPGDVPRYEGTVFCAAGSFPFAAPAAELESDAEGFLCGALAARGYERPVFGSSYRRYIKLLDAALQS